VPGEPLPLGDVVGWLARGVEVGLRNCLTLAGGMVLVMVLTAMAAMVCFVPAFFVGPPLLGGYVLMLLTAARGYRPSVGMVFMGFGAGRYWPASGVFWMNQIILWIAGIPSAYLVLLAVRACLQVARAAGPVAAMVAGAVLVPVATFPAIYVQGRLLWSYPLVLDRRRPVLDSLGESWRLSGWAGRGFAMPVLLLIIHIRGAIFSVLIAGAAFTVVAGGTSLPEAVEIMSRQFRATETAGGVPFQLTRAMFLAEAVFLACWSFLAGILFAPVLVAYRETFAAAQVEDT